MPTSTAYVQGSALGGSCHATPFSVTKADKDTES